MKVFKLFLALVVSIVQAYRIFNIPLPHSVQKDSKISIWNDRRQYINYHQNLDHRKQTTALQMSTAVEVLQNVEGFSQAFIGGTIGVMSVSVIVELKKSFDKNLEDCPYCLGNGEILCGMCQGATVLNGKPCTCCGWHGLVTCMNCKGDGRITPLILQSRAVRDPEFATDGISIDSP